ncbi:putative cytoskeleton organization protein [Talaromyces proteolyticus]|uniref:Cytoskeleton organization protein n=1 Tax=Talaromyces proteolyticus TaxID=1131652 RepID=A0AAD4KJ82_9EURO|nr:putative cytoskeleton organization protein [Talaromyces proteolyticus]KAH8693616.1 putative cytoskeleton organization protein [Talaromyces proteolyticus]
MSAQTDAVFHRRNKQIQEALDSQNLKQALQLVDKRIKKGEDTRFLRAWRAQILYLHPDETHSKQGIAATLELCRAEPPTTDLDTLEMLHSTLRQLSGHDDTARGIWEKAAKTKSQDLEIQTQWFSMSFDADDWKSAQKAAMSLQVNFPKQRKYYFWAIFLSYLLAVDPASSDMERKLFGTLAYRMISKAADSVPSDPKELLSPPRAIQTTEELFLLIKIFQSQDRNDEILKILDSENVGLKSRIVQNDWFFVREKLICLGKAEKWTDGFEYAKEFLSVPEDGDSAQNLLKERDDWEVWNLLLSSVKKINTEETTQESFEFLQKFVKRFPKSRNSHLAQLDFLLWRLESGALSQSEYLAACQEYYDANSSKLYCFDDMRKYALHLSPDQITKLVEYALGKAALQEKTPDTAQQVAIINAFKLEYCFSLFSGETVSANKVEDFVSRCLRTYRATKPPKSTATAIENQPRDDIGLLAVMSLVHASNHWQRTEEQKSPSSELIRAAALLEFLLQDSPHNYQILLLLVRVYLLLGAGSIAMKTFGKLSVKQIQNETVAHNLYTRIATIHPHGAPPIEADYKDFIPEAALSQAISFYGSVDRTTTKQRNAGLNLGSYVNVEGTIELQRRLKQSVCKFMWAFEGRRIERLAGGNRVNRYHDIVSEIPELLDQRAFDAFMNCEPLGKPTFEEKVRLGPLPKKSWIRSTQTIDRVFTTINQLQLQKPVKTDITLPELEEIALSDLDDMTLAEKRHASIHNVLLKVALLLSDSKSVSGHDIDKVLIQAEQWLLKTLQSISNESTLADITISIPSEKPQVPSWQFFHSSFLILETSKALSGILSVAKSKKAPKAGAKPSKEVVERLTKLVNQVEEAVKSNTRTLRSNVMGSGVLGVLTDLIFQRHPQKESSELNKDLEETLDASAVEIFCGELMESWEEALGGILFLK